jgi:hypothetical protein
MVENTLVKEGLTQEMISAGKWLTRQLSKRMSVDAALWLYQSETNAWQLTIATPDVKTRGKRKLYHEIQTVLSKTSVDVEHSALRLSDIAIVANDDPLVSLLRKAMKVEKGISGIRFSRNAIDGQFIEDAYIYTLRST